MRVRDVMARPVVTVAPDAPVEEAARRMGRAGVSGLPVVDGAGQLVGIVTEGDLLRLVRRLGDVVGGVGYVDLLGALFSLPPVAEVDEALRAAVARRVDEVMTRGVEVCREDDDLRDVADRLVRLGVRRLPVVGPDGRVVGIVSRGDVVRLLAGGEGPWST